MRSGDCLGSGGTFDLTRGGSTWEYRLSRLEVHPGTSRDARGSNGVGRRSAGGRMNPLFKFVTSLALALVISLSAWSAVVKYIGQPGLDIRSAFGKVRDEVVRATGNRQEPYVFGSLGAVHVAIAAAEVPNSRSSGTSASSEAVSPGPASQGTEAATLTPDEICRRDGERLERLRTSSSWEKVALFADELGCKKLLPQVLDLMERLARTRRRGGPE